MSTKQHLMVLAVAVVAGLAGGALADDEQLGRAASDPAQIAAIVAGMDAADVPDFAGQVMQAAARMPLSPRVRLQQMQAVSQAFLKAVPPDRLDAALAQLILNVPFQMMPEWVGGFKPALAEQTAAMDDAAYDKLAAGVLKRIDADETLPAEDKTIFATFAIVLMARGKSGGADEAFAGRMLPVLPAAYRDQVAAAVPAALAGDYAMLLGPDAGARLVVPSGGTTGQAEVIKPDPLGLVVKQPSLLVYDVNRPFPIPEAAGVGQPAQPTDAHAESPSPVVPPPYRGQF